MFWLKSDSNLVAQARRYFTQSVLEATWYLYHWHIYIYTLVSNRFYRSPLGPTHPREPVWPRVSTPDQHPWKNFSELSGSRRCRRLLNLNGDVLRCGDRSKESKEICWPKFRLLHYALTHAKDAHAPAPISQRTMRWLPLSATKRPQSSTCQESRLSLRVQGPK